MSVLLAGTLIQVDVLEFEDFVHVVRNRDSNPIQIAPPGKINEIKKGKNLIHAVLSLSK